MEPTTSDILSTPLHGLVIPSILILVGVYIVDSRYMLYGLLLVSILAFHKVYRGSKSMLGSATYNEFELIDKTPISKNAAFYRFKLPKENDRLKIPTGQQIEVKVKWQGKEYAKAYSPISSGDDEGFFELLIKSTENDLVAAQINALRNHQTISVRGPIGTLNYKANMAPRLVMMAEGEGIAPMLQIIGEIVRDPEDLTKIILIYSNEREDDILLKDDLDELARKYPNFEVDYVLSDPPENWNGSKGDASQVIAKHFSPFSLSTNVVVCTGDNDTLSEHIAKLGYNHDPSSLDNQVFIL